MHQVHVGAKGGHAHTLALATDILVALHTQFVEQPVACNLQARAQSPCHYSLCGPYAHHVFQASKPQVLSSQALQNEKCACVLTFSMSRPCQLCVVLQLRNEAGNKLCLRTFHTRMSLKRFEIVKCHNQEFLQGHLFRGSKEAIVQQVHPENNRQTRQAERTFASTSRGNPKLENQLDLVLFCLVSALNLLHPAQCPNSRCEGCNGIVDPYGNF